MRNMRLELKLSASSHPESEFTASEVITSRTAFLFYRSVQLIWITCVILIFFFRDSSKDIYLTYLTRWSLFLQLFYFLLAVVNTSIALLYPSNHSSHGIDQNQDKRALRRLNAQWVFFYLSLVISLTVSILYFGLLFDGSLSVSSTFEHLFNCLQMVVENLLSASPFQLTHVWVPMLFGAIYSIFNVVYWAAGDREDDDNVVYNVLNWESGAGKATLIVFLAIFVFIPICHLIHYGIFRLREKIIRKPVIFTPTHQADDLELESLPQ